MAAGPSQSDSRWYTRVFKQQVVETAESQKLTGAEVAERFGVTATSYYGWRKLFKNGNGHVPRTKKVESTALTRVIAQPTAIEAVVTGINCRVCRTPCGSVIGKASLDAIICPDCTTKLMREGANERLLRALRGK